MSTNYVSALIGRKTFAVLLLTVFMTACGAPAAQPAASSTTVPTPSASISATSSASTSAEPSASTVASSAPSPSAAPSVAASASATPSAAAPSASAAASPEPSDTGNVLPAPLLFLRAGDIVRLERDGKTITQITNEQPAQPDILAVTDFDVSPVDGSLIYVVQTPAGNTLVRSDAQGKQRTLLLPKAIVNTPRWSRDGSQIAFISIGTEEQNPGMVGGVYLIAATGGIPRLLQANDKVDPANPQADARGYSPVSWSPDGKKLLLSAYSMTVEMCSAAIKDVTTGSLIPIQAPEGMVSSCAGGVWSVDGKVIYTGMARPGPQPPVPGLWTATAETGAITPFIRGEFESGQYQLVSNPRPLNDGSVYAFASSVEKLPDPFGGVMPEYMLFVMGTTDGMALRDDPIQVSGKALWAPDNSGVIVDMVKPSINDVVTAWVPINGGPIVELGQFMGEAKQWASE